MTSTSYWHRAARMLRYRVHELEADESALCEDLHQERRAHAHWRTVADMNREALADAERYIDELERDREEDRLRAYRRGREHASAQNDEPTPDSRLPLLSTTGENMRTVWFRTRADALEYAENHGFRQPPEKRRVWLDLAWREEWSLRVPRVEEPA